MVVGVLRSTAMRDTSNSPRSGSPPSLSAATTRSRASARHVLVAIVLTALTPLVVLAALSRPPLAVAAAAGALATGLLMHARHR